MCYFPAFPKKGICSAPEHTFHGFTGASAFMLAGGAFGEFSF